MPAHFYVCFIHFSFLCSHPPHILNAPSPFSMSLTSTLLSVRHTSPLCFGLSRWDFTHTCWGAMSSLSFGKHRVRLISCFKPLPAKLNPGKAMRWGRSGNGRKEPRGLSIHHSASSWSAHLPHTARRKVFGLMWSPESSTPSSGSDQSSL